MKWENPELKVLGPTKGLSVICTFGSNPGEAGCQTGASALACAMGTFPLDAFLSCGSGGRPTANNCSFGTTPDAI